MSIVFVEKILEAFAMQKLLTFCQQKILAYFRRFKNIWNFNVTFTNDIVSFEQPGPDICSHYYPGI